MRAVAVLVVCCSLIGPGTAEAQAPDPVSAVSVGMQAYDYGFPLLEVLRVRQEMTSVACPDRRGNAPVNRFSHVDRFADATARTVVAPNTDTLYSIAHLDLGKGPLVLSHPRMGRRYYSFATLDPYTNVVATPGTREDGGGAARILYRWSKRQGRVKASRFDRVVTSPYRRLWVIGRTLATDRADQRRAFRKMRRYTLTDLRGHAPRSPADCKPGEPITAPTPTDGAAFVAALNAALADNPPPKRDAPLLAGLARYGIGRGSTDPDPASRAALHAGIETAAASLTTRAKVHALVQAQQHDGWYEPEAHIGSYGTDYTFRAYIAALGLGANTREEATYPAGITDGTGLVFLGANDYQLTFAADQLPPARYFWSLTMYDADGYLVANPENRYSLGPSHPPLLKRPDGSVVIAISQDKPAAADVNWLPSPPGQFRLNLRLYGPAQSALDGTWEPPPVSWVTPP
jgi:hypothetical protein